jgi:hypothetical protein
MVLVGSEGRSSFVVASGLSIGLSRLAVGVGVWPVCWSATQGRTANGPQIEPQIGVPSTGCHTKVVSESSAFRVTGCEAVVKLERMGNV